MPKRGENITKRKDGRWEARIIKGYNENGKAQYRFLYAKTYAEVKAKKAEAVANTKVEQEVKKSNTTYNAVLTAFLQNRKNSVKESTYAHYCDIIDVHIRPALGGMRLRQISSSTVDRFANDMLEHGRVDGKGGLSPKSVKDMLSIIRLSFKYAVKEGIMTRESVDFATPKNEVKSIQILSFSDQEKLETVSSDSDDPNRFGVYLCLYTGLRLGELCALRWSDIDFDHALLNVHHTISRVRNTDSQKGSKTKILISSPKTKASERQIPLPGLLVKKMETHREAAENDSYLLTGTQHYIEPKNYYVKYKRWLEECGLDDYNFHALRHTFATRCIEKGFDPKSLSEILGHSNVNITLNRYVHPSMDLKRRQMEALISR